MDQIDENTPIVQDLELRPAPSRVGLVLTEGQDRGEDNEEERSSAATFGVRLFIGAFILPVTAAAIYLFAIASDRYVAEAKFMVRSPASNSGMAGMEAMVASQGLTRATDETFAVNEYIMSRDAMNLLIAHNRLREIMSDSAGDFINRFPNFYTRNNSEEMFYAYKKMVSAYIDGATGMSTLEVVAFQPRDARNIAAALLIYAEGLINKLNERAHQDALRYANAVVARARNELMDIQSRLTEFRNKSQMVDTSKESSAALDAISRLSNEVAHLEATIIQQKAMAPNSPAIASLSEKANSYREEIARERALIVGRDSSMASKLGAFERLVLEREIATKALASAENSMDRARQEAEQQHLYLQVVVAPNVPDQAKYPRRALSFLASFIAALLAYLCVRAIVQSALEHS